MKKITLLALVATALTAAKAGAQTNLAYNPLTPCRVVDTRSSVSTNGGPALGSNASRSFQVRGLCGVPMTAKAVSLNITVTQATQQSWLAVWPSAESRPLVSSINFEPSDPAVANGAIVGLSASSQDLSVYNSAGLVHVILDITGYFQ